MTDRRAACNKGFAIAGVPCFADIFVQGGSSVLRIKFGAKTPRHRKPPKRYSQWFVDLKADSGSQLSNFNLWAISMIILYIYYV